MKKKKIMAIFVLFVIGIGATGLASATTFDKKIINVESLSIWPGEPIKGDIDISTDKGATNTTEKTIEVKGGVKVVPIADFSPSSPYTIPPMVNETVQFTDNSTDDGYITSWSWHFGDGNTSTKQNPKHIYNQAGNYTVTLTVTDNDGATDTASKVLKVIDVPPLNVTPVNNETVPFENVTVENLTVVNLTQKANVYTDKECYVIGENVTRGIENTLNQTILIGCLVHQKRVNGEWKDLSLLKNYSSK